MWVSPGSLCTHYLQASLIEVFLYWKLLAPDETKYEITAPGYFPSLWYTNPAVKKILGGIKKEKKTLERQCLAVFLVLMVLLFHFCISFVILRAGFHGGNMRKLGLLRSGEDDSFFFFYFHKSHFLFSFTQVSSKIIMLMSVANLKQGVGYNSWKINQKIHVWLLSFSIQWTSKQTVNNNNKNLL